MGPVTECYRCDRAPCSTWNGRPVCGDCLDYYREGAAPFPDESAGSESIASGGSDRHDENSAPAAGSREAATDPPTGLTNPTPDASSSPVPGPVVNEVAEEFWKAWSDPDRDFNMADVEDITKTFLSLPTVKAALAALTVADAHRKIIALQAVERDEAQAKLEAAEASLRMAHEVLSITTNYLLGQGEGEGRDPDECRALATNEALAGFERLDALLFPKGGV